MLGNKVARPPGLTTAYWLIERPGIGGSEVFTVVIDAEIEALPIFSFPDEAELFLRLGGLEEEGWRMVESAAEELVPRLAACQRAGVRLVALDPLPEMVDSAVGATIALVTLSLSSFVERQVARRGEGRFMRG